MFLRAMILLALPFSLCAAEKAEARAKRLAPYLEESTFGIIRVDLGRVNVDAVEKTFAKYLGKLDDDLARFPKLLQEMKKTWNTLQVQDFYVLLSAATIMDREVPRIVVQFKDAATAKKAEPKLEQVPLFQEFQFLQFGSTLVGADKGSLARLKMAKAAAQPELAKAMSASDSPVQFILYTGSDLIRRSLEENVEQLPEELGGGSIKLITRGIRWAVVSLEGPPKMKLTLTIQAKDEATALELTKVMRTAAKIAKEKGDLDKVIPGGSKLLFEAIPIRKGDQLVKTIDEEEVAGPISTALKKMRTAASRAERMNVLKQMALGMHNYASSQGNGLPGPWSMKKKKRLLSWRVHLLPYLEQQQLYQQFKLDEPWDSPHNKKLIKLMPKIFAPRGYASLSRQGKTTILLPVHKESIFPPDSKGMKFQDIKDGTSATIMIVEADPKNAVIWTKPDDLMLDPKNPKKGLRMYDEGFLAALGDGSVRYFSAKTKPKSVWALFTRDGGETIDD